MAQLWALVKARRAGILEQVDEETDVLPKLVERYTGVPAPVVSALLAALVQTMLDKLDVPVREVNAGETAH